MNDKPQNNNSHCANLHNENYLIAIYKELLQTLQPGSKFHFHFGMITEEFTDSPSVIA